MTEEEDQTAKTARLKKTLLEWKAYDDLHPTTPPSAASATASAAPTQRVVTGVRAGRSRSRSPTERPDKIRKPGSASPMRRDTSPISTEVNPRMGVYTQEKLREHANLNGSYYMRQYAEFLSEFNHRMYYEADNGRDDITMRLTRNDKLSDDRKHSTWDVSMDANSRSAIAQCRTRERIATECDLKRIKRCICTEFDFPPSCVAVTPRAADAKGVITSFEIFATWRAPPVTDVVRAVKEQLSKAEDILCDVSVGLGKLIKAIESAPDL